LEVIGSCSHVVLPTSIFRLSERSCQLDEVEQTSVKLIKEWSHVVCNKSAPAHSTCVGTVSRRRYGWPSDVSSWPRHLYRRRPEHENRVVVFRRLPELWQSICRPSRSRHWWLSWRDWIMATVSYLACLSTLHVDSSRYWMRRHVMSFQPHHRWASHSTRAARPRIENKIAVLVHKVLHGAVPCYLGPLVRVSDLSGRRYIRSASTDSLVMTSFKLSIIGSWTFKVAAAQTWNGSVAWNSLPNYIPSKSNTKHFKKLLKLTCFSTLLLFVVTLNVRRSIL